MTDPLSRSEVLIYHCIRLLTDITALSQAEGVPAEVQKWLAEAVDSLAVSISILHQEAPHGTTEEHNPDSSSEGMAPRGPIYFDGVDTVQ